MTRTAASSINVLLRTRGAELLGGGTQLIEAKSRILLSQSISREYPAFERIRDAIVHCVPFYPKSECEHRLISKLIDYKVIVFRDNSVFESYDNQAKKYIRGGWLEEYCGLAVCASGADEVRVGQVIKWSFAGCSGSNEVDVIARFGEKLLFVSAKALKSNLASSDSTHRSNLMAALQEADNLADHFGSASSSVVLIVTTDMFDDGSKRPRYPQLHGKAAALNVHLVSAEGLEWGSLTNLFSNISKQ